MISRDLQPGTRVSDKRGNTVTLDRRKTINDDHQGLPFHPGWWCREGGGIADFVLDDPNSGWYIDGPPR